MTTQETKEIAEHIALPTGQLSAVIYSIVEALKKQPNFDTKAFEQEMRQTSHSFDPDSIAYTFLSVLSSDKKI